MRKLLRSFWYFITTPVRFITRVMRRIKTRLRHGSQSIASYFKDEEIDDTPIAESGLFTQALEAECAAAQGRFFQYGDWRTSVAPQHVPGAVLQLSGIDPVAFAGCIADPRTAVEVLDDASDALRLGFREAVPSWVVGERVRRGELSENDIERDIADQAAKRSAAEQPKQPAPSSAGAAGPAKR